MKNSNILPSEIVNGINSAISSAIDDSSCATIYNTGVENFQHADAISSYLESRNCHCRCNKKSDHLQVFIRWA